MRTAFLLLFLPSLAQANLQAFCDRHPQDIWEWKIENEKATLLKEPQGEEVTIGQPYEFKKVKLAGDTGEDLSVDLGDCGRDACVEGIFASCGDGRRYFAAFSPNYYSEIEVDPDHFVEKDGVKWRDVVYSEYENQGDHILTLGWRLRFDGDTYSENFLPEEYNSLLRKAKAGKDFAFRQLSVAYQHLSKNPEDPDLKAIKSQLMNRAFLKKMLARSGTIFEFFPESVRQDKELALIAVRHDILIDRKEFSPKLLEDRDVQAALLERDGDALKYLPLSARANPKLVELALKKDRFALEYASESLRSDRKLMLKWSKKYKVSAEALAPPFKKDKELAKTFIANDSESYIFFDEPVRADPKVARLAFRERGGTLLPHAPENILNDRNLLMVASKGDGSSVKAMPEKVVADRDFRLQLVCGNANTFEYFSDAYKADRELALIAASRYPSFYLETPRSLQEDRGFALEVAKNDPYVYQDLPDSLKADPEIARSVFRRISLQWSSAPASIQNDPAIAALAKAAPSSVEIGSKIIGKLCEKALAKKK